MAKAYITSVYNPAVARVDVLRRAAEQDRRGRHTLTEDPDEADVILFVEADPGHPFYEKVVRHPLARRYPRKSFLYTRTDFPLAVMQGIYVSVPRRGYNPQWMRSGPYLVACEWEPAPPPPEDPLLFSFIGAVGNHPIRERLHALAGPEAVIEDTSPYWPYGALPPEEEARLIARYAAIGRRSRFILAPRGKAVSSIRLFEALRMGRPPVILADDWVEPEGPDWSQISVRVAERDVDALPRLLRALEPEAEAMGLRARAAWEAWFSERAVFDTFVEWCLAMRAQQRLPVPLLRPLACAQTFRVFHAKRIARRLLDRYGPKRAPRRAGLPASTPTTPA
jgi:hypothetical protein